MRSCPVCGRQTWADYCPEHDPASEANRLAAQPYRAAYQDPEYRRNRAIRYHAARGLCEACGAELRGKLHPAGRVWESHHVVELSEGGTNAVGNLRVLCVPCHRRQTGAARHR